MHTRTLPVPVTELIPLSSLTKSERILFENVISPYGNPSQIFDRKITALARLLNCSEDDATHILLHNL